MSTLVGNTTMGTTSQGIPLSGILMNGASLTAGYHGNGLQLDGIDDYVDLGYHGDSCFGNITLCVNGLTVAMWLWPNVTDSQQIYFSNSDGKNVCLQFKQRSHGQLGVKLKTLTHKYKSSDYELTNRWTHIAVSWYPEKKLVVYIDGCVHDDVAGIPELNTYDIKNTVIGKNPKNNNKYAAGIIDEFNFWEWNLDAAKIMVVFLK